MLSVINAQYHFCCHYAECRYAERRGAMILALTLKHQSKCFFDGTVHLKNVNNYFNNKIYSYLETSGGQSSKL
jgi:hypothetical protein